MADKKKSEYSITNEDQEWLDADLDDVEEEPKEEVVEKASPSKGVVYDRVGNGPLFIVE